MITTKRRPANRYVEGIKGISSSINGARIDGEICWLRAGIIWRLSPVWEWSLRDLPNERELLLFRSPGLGEWGFCSGTLIKSCSFIPRQIVCYIGQFLSNQVLTYIFQGWRIRTLGYEPKVWTVLQVLRGFKNVFFFIHFACNFFPVCPDPDKNQYQLAC